MSADLLLVDVAEGIATLTLNRPQAMNALSRQLRAAIVAAFDQLREQPDVDVRHPHRRRARLLRRPRSQGARRRDGGGGDTESATRPAPTWCARSSRLRPAVIGAINGFAITGGFELALACDVLIASTAARFADTHARVGILPGWGLSQKLSRTIGIYRAKELSLSGNYLSAEQAADWGLVNRVVEPAAAAAGLPRPGRGHAVVRARGDARLQAADRRRLRGDVRRRPAHRGDGVARPRAIADAGGDRRAPRRGAVARARPVEGLKGREPVSQCASRASETPAHRLTGALAHSLTKPALPRIDARPLLPRSRWRRRGGGERGDDPAPRVGGVDDVVDLEVRWRC